MGALSLPDAGSVYVDANTVIYAVERIEPYRTLLEPLWQAAQQQRISLATSELTWLETLAKPLRDNNRQLETLFRAFLTGQEMMLVPATLPMWEHAARLRGLGLKTPDALHAATAIAIGCSLFVTNDRFPGPISRARLDPTIGPIDALKHTIKLVYDIYVPEQRREDQFHGTRSVIQRRRSTFHACWLCQSFNNRPEPRSPKRCAPCRRM